MKRIFRVWTTDMVEHRMLPAISRALADEAPQAQVSFRSLNFSLPREELEDGRADLAIAGFFSDIPDGFYKQKLFSDEFRCAVRADHPILKRGKLSLETYGSLQHVLIAPGGELSGPVDRVLTKHKLKRAVTTGSSSFLAAGWAVAESDAILTAPSRLLASFERYLPIKVFDLPLNLPAITVVQVWHERQHRDPGHQWLRDHIAKSLY